MTLAGTVRVPPPVNDPNRTYLPGSPERAELKARLAQMAAERIDIPIVIGGREIRTGRARAGGDAARPPARPRRLARCRCRARAAGDRGGRRSARREWASWRWQDRAAVFLRAAELLTTTWRATLNAATMLGQSKTVIQAEIDAASELIDFWRFNPSLRAGALRRAADQHARDVERARVPAARGVRLRGHPVQLHLDRRQPADRAGADGQHGRLEAGVERDAERLLHHAAARGGRAAARRHQLRARRRGADLEHRCSTRRIWPASTSPAAPPSSTACGRRSGSELGSYRSYPRLVGETGGKDFIVAHPSADVQELAVAIARGGFEYQGQKCSAASRIYVPQSLWPEVRDRVVAMMREMQMGDVQDFRTFLGAVIDRKAFTKISGYLEDARSNATIVQGGGDRRCGRVLRRADAGRNHRPRLPAAVRGDLRAGGHGVCLSRRAVGRDARARRPDVALCADRGGVRRDRAAIRQAVSALRNAAGNFYINDKPTGAVVGQQPFGGARASGTNDKAGSKINLLRWVSARTIKETFSPPRDWRYPYMVEQ